MAIEIPRQRSRGFGSFFQNRRQDKQLQRLSRQVSLHLERLEDRHMMDGAGFVNTIPPEDPDTIVGVAGIMARDDHHKTSRGTIQLRLDPLGNDQLPESSESLRIKSVSATRLGHTVTISEDGRRLLYDAGEGGLQASDTFYYIVESNDGKLGKANVNLSLKYERDSGGGGGNTRRYTTSDRYDVLEDSPEQQFNVLRNDREFRDGEIFEVALQSSYYDGPLADVPPVGSIRIADDGKSLLYQPSAGFSGTENYIYTVRDENGDEATATTRFDVEKPIYGVNYKEDIVQVVFGTGEKISPVLFHRRATTPVEPQIDSIDAPDYVGEFSISSGGAKIIYEPSTDFIGNFNLSYTVRYGPEEYQFITDTLSYRVDNTFLAADNWFAVEPNSDEVQLDVLANDPAFEIWTYRYRKQPVDLEVASTSTGNQGGQLRVAADGKSVFYKPALGFVGDETFSYEVLGSDGARDSATVTVHVAQPVVDPSGVDRFVNEAELQQFFLDKAVARFGRQFGITEPRYAPAPESLYSPYVDYVSRQAFAGNSQSSAPSLGIDHSKTNTQVTGIDEADIVETDGHYVYTFTNGELVIVDVSDPSTARPVSFTEFEGRFDLMYLQGDRMTLLKNGSTWGGGAEVLVLDISDRRAPTVLERTEIEGAIADSRAIGDRVLLVVKSSFLVPELGGEWLVEPIPPTSSSDNKPDFVSTDIVDAVTDLAYLYAGDRGEAGLWRSETLDEYVERASDLLIEIGLPSFKSYDAAGEMIDSGLLTSATGVHKPVAGSDLLVSLVTIDAGDDAVGPLAAATSFVSDSNTEVYVSAESAYVFAFDPAAGNSTVYKLDVLDEGLAPIVASGTVGGKLLNQFSVDEYEGYLRVATTEMRSETIETRRGSRNVQRQRFNNVVVLEQQGNRMTMVGEVTNLAPTETIHSVRFMGDRAYVVTFRRVDPLFALDMSDPTNPTVKGALKIPGFSNYLHPVGSDYLIGIGRDANEITGRLGPLQITLFNVSDLSDPYVADQLTFEGANWVDSEAWIEHHAVSFFAESGVLAIPIAWSQKIELEGEEADKSGRYQTENHSAIWTVKVDTTSAEGASLAVTGSVEHEAASHGQFGRLPLGITNVWRGGWSYDPGSPARRALRVAESLITVSNEYIKINDLNDPSIHLGKVYLGKLTLGDSFMIDEDRGTNVIDVRANDLVDPGGALSPIIDFSQPNRGGIVSLAEGAETLSFTPDQDFFGHLSFTYTVLDELRGEETATVQLTVNNVPDDPTAVDDVFYIDVDSTSTVLNVRENDINPDAGYGYPIFFDPWICDCATNISISLTINLGNTNGLRIIEFGEPDQNGTAELDDWGQLIYTPAESFSGIETFSYTISTVSDLIDVGMVTIHVGDTTPPVANPVVENANSKTIPVGEVSTKTIATRRLPAVSTAVQEAVFTAVQESVTTRTRFSTPAALVEAARSTLTGRSGQHNQRIAFVRMATDRAQSLPVSEFFRQEASVARTPSGANSSAIDFSFEEITASRQEQLHFTLGEEFSSSLAIDLANLLDT